MARKSDLITVGTKFESWITLDMADKDDKILCQCVCGFIMRIKAINLRTNVSKSCKNCKNPPLDITGERYNRLLAIQPTNKRSAGRAVIWLFVCDCGTEIEREISTVRTGATKSCGCLVKETSAINSKNRITHGLCKSREYNSWRGLMQRCAESESAAYYEEGIRVCNRWAKGENSKSGFECFLEDMGPRPEGFSIDRINPNGNYEPNNCRWATESIQGLNKRPRKTSKSGKTGVLWRVEQNCWNVAIKVAGKRIYLGSFKELETAIMVKEKAEMRYFGEMSLRFSPGTNEVLESLIKLKGITDYE